MQCRSVEQPAAAPTGQRCGRFQPGRVWLGLCLRGMALLLLVGHTQAQSTAPGPASPPASAPVITLPEALRLARAYNPQFQAAQTNAQVAHESRLQARDARLPTVSALNQFIYTQGNGTPSGRFIANDGVHVYNEQAIVREDVFALIRNGQSMQAKAAEAVALAEEEIARRGLVVTVVQHFYDLVTAQRKIVTATQSLTDAKNFVDITQKQEEAGVVSHVDVVKAQIAEEQRNRDTQTAALSAEEAKLSLAVLLFRRFDQAFTVEDHVDPLPALPYPGEAQSQAERESPTVASTHAAIAEARSAATVARYEYLPSLATTFYYGIDANQLTAVSPLALGTSQSQLPNNLVTNRQNLGYAAEVTLEVPLWNWGATRSKVRAADAMVSLAEVKAGFAERELKADLHSAYAQARAAREQVTSLERSRDLADENLRLTMLRYRAGEANALEAVSAEDSLSAARDAYEDGLNHFYAALGQLQTLRGNL